MRTFKQPIKLKHLNIAQEAIAFQSGAFHKELTLIIEPYVGKENTRKDLDKLETSIEKLITKTTNAEINVSIAEGYDPCILLNPIDVNSIFSEYWGNIWSKPDEMKQLKKEKQRAGTVDLENSKVTGAFAKSFSTIFIGPKYFATGYLTAAELSAILLHEVGHYFGMCEMLDRTAGTNQVLISVDRCLKNNTDVKQREVILRYAGEALDLDERVIQKAVDSNNDTVSTTILVVETYKGMYRDDQSKSYYSYNSPEYTSDEFAARHGAGKDLVYALDKIFAKFMMFSSPVQKRGTVAYLLIEVLKVVMFMLAIASVAIWAELGGLLILLTLNVWFGDSSEAGEPTYDSPLNRLQRIRRQLVEYAKAPNLNKNVVAKLLDDVKIVDQLLAQYTPRKDFITFVSDVLSFTGNTKNRDYQIKLEQLVMNDLFLKTLELKQA